MDEDDFELVTPFLTDDPVFALGVEFGMVYGELKRKRPQVHLLIHRENEDRVLLLLDRMGYAVGHQRAGIDSNWMTVRGFKK